MTVRIMEDLEEDWVQVLFIIIIILILITDPLHQKVLRQIRTTVSIRMDSLRREAAVSLSAFFSIIHHEVRGTEKLDEWMDTVPFQYL